MWLEHIDERVVALFPLLSKGLNVKKIRLLERPDWYLSYSLVPRYENAGKMFGSQVTMFADRLRKLPKSSVRKWRDGKPVWVNGVKLSNELVSLKVSTRKGFVSGQQNGMAIFFNTKLTQDLVDEGLVREVIRHIQQNRKDKGLELTKRIGLFVCCCSYMEDVLKRYWPMIK